MASLPVASAIEVLDLRHFSARQLRPLLEQEARVWNARLRWDYSSSIELLLQYLESRILQGFVALDRGRICGYSFCVFEGHKAVIGDAFSAGHRTLTDIDTTRTLLIHMIEMLRHTPTVDRVESQLLLYDAGAFASLFADQAFTIYPRLFLESNLTSPAPQMRAAPSQLSLTPWGPQDYQATGELIYTCYLDHADAQINDQYKSLHGSLRFLHNIVRFPGCGVFEPSHSWILRERSTGTMVGCVLCSHVGAGVAHITQLCISQAYRGQGLGALLLGRCADSLRAAGFRAITLTVTEANTQAVQLYQRFHFTQRHRFDAMVLDTRPKR